MGHGLDLLYSMRTAAIKNTTSVLLSHGVSGASMLIFTCKFGFAIVIQSPFHGCKEGNAHLHSC